MDSTEQEANQSKVNESRVKIINEPSVLNSSSSSQHSMLQNTNPNPSPLGDFIEGQKPLQLKSKSVS